MEKEIEKMAKVLYGIYCGEDKCGECKSPNCESYRRAELLFNAGYRKSHDEEIRKETAREIVQFIKDKGILRYGGYLLDDSDFISVGHLYGVEVEE